MEYDDILSHYQQNLQNQFHYSDPSILYTQHNNRSQYSHRTRFDKPVTKLINFVSDITSSNCYKTYLYLIKLQLDNYEKNCDSLFLDYKNWFLYQMQIEAHHKLRRMFGYEYIHGRDMYANDFLNDEYYKTLSKSYYKARKNVKHDPTLYNFNAQDLKCFQMKDIHCCIMLHRICSLGQLELNKTLDILYYALPSFSNDICMVIIHFMAPFPQTPPKPCRTYYTQGFEVVHYVPCMPSSFYISQKELIYPLKMKIEEDDTIHLQWDDAGIDIQNVELDTKELKKYILREIYHLYSHHRTSFVFVGKLESISESHSMFIYIDYHYKDISVLLSEFWMDLWKKIVSNCIKVDCYNDTELPQFIPKANI